MIKKLVLLALYFAAMAGLAYSHTQKQNNLELVARSKFYKHIQDASIKVAEYNKNNVQINFCSGIVVNKEKNKIKVLTARHCRRYKKSKLVVTKYGRRFAANILKTDTSRDFMYVEATIKDIPVKSLQVVPNLRPIVGEDIYVCSVTPWGVPTIIHGRVMYIFRNGNVLTTVTAIPGMSGSPIISETGIIYGVISATRFHRLANGDAVPLPVPSLGALIDK